MSSRQFAAYDDENRPKYDPYSNSVPIADIARQAALAIANPPPAIIQQAVRSFHALKQETVRSFKERNESGEAFLRNCSELRLRYEEEFKTWDECCLKVLGVTRQAVHQREQRVHDSLARLLVDNENLSIGGTKSVNPPLTKVKQLIAQADEKALKQVEKSREEKPATAKAKTEPEPAIVDKVGREVPAYALGYWKRSTEIQHVLSALSDLRTTIRKANESGDRLWCAFDTQDLLLSFDALYTSVSNFMPYAVCKKCNGVETKTLCSMCHGTGLINKTTYGFNKS